jgi:hypothetical protein
MQHFQIPNTNQTTTSISTTTTTTTTKNYNLLKHRSTEAGLSHRLQTSACKIKTLTILPT